MLSEGGQPAWVRMEHVWIQAALDFYPGRAYRNLEADSWINLDPSFKQYEYLEGIDVAQVAGIDGQALADGFLASGTVNDAEGWIQGLAPVCSPPPRAAPSRRCRSTSPGNNKDSHSNFCDPGADVCHRRQSG